MTRRLSVISFCLILSICLALALTGCSRVTVRTGRSEPEDEQTDTPVPEEAGDSETGLSEEQVMEYFESGRGGENLDACFIEDLDADGRDEAVAVVRNAYDEIRGFYVLHSRNGQIEQIGDMAGNESGYGIENVELVRMRGSDERYIHVKLTNGVNLHGFSLYELKNDEIRLICSSASATGEGDDGLLDPNADGVYDGYYENRWSYDVFYYPVCKNYDWIDGAFVLNACSVDLPDYPGSVEEVVTQYLSLSLLNLDHCPEADERLSMLYSGDPEEVSYFLLSDLAVAVVNDVMGFNDQGLNIQVSGNGDSATVLVSDNGADGASHEYTFRLIQKDYGWSIESIK